MYKIIDNNYVGIINSYKEFYHGTTNNHWLSVSNVCYMYISNLITMTPIYVCVQLTSLPVDQCGEYVRCGQCLDTADPVCGWCILDSK